MKYAFSNIALRKYTFDAFCCSGCGLLQIVDPHWLDEAYSEAIAACDTGLVARNISLGSWLKPFLFHLFGTGGNYVDFAAGTGLLVRLMRDAGHDFYWRDSYCTNIHARGFEYKNGKECHAVTAFEVLEHLVDPFEFVSAAISETKAGVFVFTSELYSGQPPKPEDWWYYALNAGQHISFYQKKTLDMLAKRFDMKFLSNGNIHIFCTDMYYDRIKSYFESKIVRRMAIFQSSRSLQTKTMTDHILLLNG
jgi:hypothetical protein